EALSRGAAEVVFVEKHPAAVTALRNNLELLGTPQAQLIHNDALHYLQNIHEPFDFIFLDPPFRQQLITPVLTLLLTKSLLKPTGMLYLEQEAEAADNFTNLGLFIRRTTHAGQTRSFLLKINKT
ncbi:MAG: RsmD family RNA methyltransferase, partial [Thiothrix sp.]